MCPPIQLTYHLYYNQLGGRKLLIFYSIYRAVYRAGMLARSFGHGTIDGYIYSSPHPVPKTLPELKPVIWVQYVQGNLCRFTAGCILFALYVHCKE